MISLIVKTTVIIIVILLFIVYEEKNEADLLFNENINYYFVDNDELSWEEYFVVGIYVKDFLGSRNYFKKALKKEKNPIIYLYFGALYGGYLNKSDVIIDTHMASEYLKKSIELDNENLVPYFLLWNLKNKNKLTNQSTEKSIVIDTKSKIDFYSKEITSYSYALMANLEMLSCQHILNLGSLSLYLPLELPVYMINYYNNEENDLESSKLLKLIIMQLNKPTDHELYLFKYEKKASLLITAIKLLKQKGMNVQLIQDLKFKLKEEKDKLNRLLDIAEKWDIDKHNPYNGICIDNPYWDDAKQYLNR